MRALSATAIYGIPALLCAGWTVFAGKDLNWDLLHYHYYVAHAVVEGRFGRDYFPAGTVSYLNPFGYLPFYLMVRAGWHSVLVSMLLAAFHALNIALLYLLSWRLFEHRPPRSRAALSALAAALGSASMVFWAIAGTSFLDPLLTVPMLGGVLLLLGARLADAVRRAALAGALFGLAASLKYSNAFFALAGLVLAASVPAGGWRARARASGAYAAGGAVAVALVAGPWLARLGHEFGNPFFPHLNAWFHSPEAPEVMLSAGRFAPKDFIDALLMPLRLASPEVMVYAEISAPDLRFGMLLLAACGLAAATPWRKAAADGQAQSGASATRLFAFFLLCLAVWIATSANARYGLLVLLLVGPCLAWLVERASARYAYVTLAVLLAAQVTACAMASPKRWFVAERWSRNWFGISAPERALEEPVLYLSVDPQAMTAAVPFLHPDSSFVSVRAQDGAAPQLRRLDALREKEGGRVRVRGAGLRLQADGKPRPDVVEVYDWTLSRFGYRVDTSDCFQVAWRLDDDDIVSRWANALSTQQQSQDRFLSFGSCALAAAVRDPREIAEERRVSALFDRIERACPGLFGGLTAVTEKLGPEWSRTYPALEARMHTQAGHVTLAPWFKLRYHYLGRLEDWSSDAPPIPEACRNSAS